MYQKKGNVYYTPDELGYQDRGMIKWQGFLLSDHNEQMKEEGKDRAFVAPKLLQSFEKRATVLSNAYYLKREVAIQMNILENAHYQKDIIGYVLGVDDNQIFLQTEDKIQMLSMDTIRNVQITDSTKWFKKDE